MAYYKSLEGLKGIQTDFNKFVFSWNSAVNDYQAHFLWIYKEDELDKPQMWKYAQCINNRIQVTFQYSNISLQEIKKLRFLIFLSDDQRAPSQKNIYCMSLKPEFLCTVCCGTAEIKWKWIPDKTGMQLLISSDKKIPEGLLYYDYFYGNKNFCFDIPGDINSGENYYGDVYFPDLPAQPQLRSREPNLRLEILDGRTGKNEGGFFRKIADMIRH